MGEALRGLPKVSWCSGLAFYTSRRRVCGKCAKHRELPVGNKRIGMGNFSFLCELCPDPRGMGSLFPELEESAFVPSSGSAVPASAVLVEGEGEGQGPGKSQSQDRPWLYLSQSQSQSQGQGSQPARVGSQQGEGEAEGQSQSQGSQLDESEDMFAENQEESKEESKEESEEESQLPARPVDPSWRAPSPTSPENSQEYLAAELLRGANARGRVTSSGNLASTPQRQVKIKQLT